MKINLIFIFVIPIVLFCTAYKNISFFCLDDSPQFKIDNHFLGSWKMIEDTDKNGLFLIEKYDPFQYKITYINGFGKIIGLNQNHCFISEINNNVILNISYAKSNINGYMFVKLSDIDTVLNQFTVSVIKEEALESVSTRQEIRALFSNNLNNPNFYNKPVHFQKIDTLRY